MSLQRCASPASFASSALFKFASTTRSCPFTSRQFTSYLPARQSSKRKLVTTSAWRPHTLPSDPPLPPRNVDIPESSLASSIPQVNDIRPPDLSRAQEGLRKDSASQAETISETEAQKSKPISTAASTPTASSEPVAKSKRSKLRARKAAINLTPAAITHLRGLLEQPDPKLIRIGVKNKGCSGLAYHLEYVEKAGQFDETVEAEGVKVLIDSKALFSIIGSEMDWVEDKLSARFVFTNPNIKEQCGCGESFMV